jgi:hypothetical protein
VSTADLRPDPFDIDALRIRPGDPAAMSRRPRRRHRAWEYHTCETDTPMDVESLDALGGRGWRLCGVVRHGGLICYTFARPSRR